HEDDVLKLFRSYGRVANVRIPLEPMSKGHRGYAFVTMNSSSEAQACITALHGAEFGGSGLLVEVSKRKAPHAKTPGVYLGPRCESGSPDRGVSLESTGRRFSEGQTSSVHARSGGRTNSRNPTTTTTRTTAHLRNSRNPDHGRHDRRHLHLRGDSVDAEPLSEPAAACASAPVRSAVKLRPAEPLVDPPEPGGEPLIEEEPSPPHPKATGLDQLRESGVVKSRSGAQDRDGPMRPGRGTSRPLNFPSAEKSGESCGRASQRHSSHVSENCGSPGRNLRLSAPRQAEQSPRSSRISQLEAANVRAAAQQTADGLLLQFQRQGFSDPCSAASECLKVALALLGSSVKFEDSKDSKDSGQPACVPQKLLSPDEFKNPSGFLRVYGDPLASASRRSPGFRGPGSLQDGNWRCEQCSNVNFPRRQRCHKCQAMRSSSGDTIVLQYCLRVYELLRMGRQRANSGRERKRRNASHRSTASKRKCFRSTWQTSPCHLRLEFGKVAMLCSGRFMPSIEEQPGWMSARSRRRHGASTWDRRGPESLLPWASRACQRQSELPVEPRWQLCHAAATPSCGRRIRPSQNERKRVPAGRCHAVGRPEKHEGHEHYSKHLLVLLWRLHLRLHLWKGHQSGEPGRPFADLAEEDDDGSGSVGEAKPRDDFQA
ncbi:unnamed protein product, partial [Polarella glacialis]